LTAEAVEALFRSGCDVQYVVAGRGPDEEAVRRWCVERPQFSTFLGYVPNAGSTLTPTLDVLSLPTSNDGMPMAIVEAMAHGVVVISTPIGGIPDLVDDGVTGFLIRERTSQQIAASLRVLAHNPTLLRKMSAAALERHRTHFSADAMRHAYEALYAALGRSITAITV
jgi:glycosyltransferase involved in cell wall biosynthesis